VRKFGLVIATVLLVLATGCASETDSSDYFLEDYDEPEVESTVTDYSGRTMLERLKLYANDDWEYDSVGDNSDASPMAVYSSSECSVWVFDSVSTIEALEEQDFFLEYTTSQRWWGEDGYSSFAVVLLPNDPYRSCSKSAVLAFNWSGLSGIENLNLVGADLPLGRRGTSSYQFGFDASAGASPALIGNFGGVTPYCEGLLAMHGDWNAQDKADYVLGCQDRYN
jgi:hypothetical protein